MSSVAVSARTGFFSTKRPAKKFVPSQAQVECAQRRIIGTLVKRGGAIEVSRSAAARMLVPSIFNRGCELGQDKNQVRATIEVALVALTVQRKLVWADGYLALGPGAEMKSRHRLHKQKYPQRRSA